MCSDLKGESGRFEAIISGHVKLKTLALQQYLRDRCKEVVGQETVEEILALCKLSRDLQ